MTVLKKTEGVALYAQIREYLRAQINNGVLKPGDKLPSEDDLAVQFEVSRMTLRQGLSDLLDEGILYRRHGVGTFVSPSQVNRDHTRLTNIFEHDQLDNNADGSLCVLIADILPARLKIANALGLKEGELTIRIKTLRSADDIPITVHDAYMPYKLFPELLQEDLESCHIWSYMERHGYPVKQASQRVEAHEADEKIAKLLEVEEGSPILHKERTVYAEDGTPVEFVLCYNRGDRYSLTMKLVR